MAEIPEIVTEGTGRFEQLGEQAELNIVFSAVGKTRSEAVRELGTRLQAVDVPIIAAQVIRHRRLWVHNEYDNRKAGRVTGCRAGQDIDMLIPDPLALEEVLGVLVAAEPTGIDGPRWILRDAAGAQREAQHRAVADARLRAEGYAAALGGRLGPLRTLSEPRDWQGGRAVGLGMRQVAFAANSSDGPDISELGLEPELVTVTAQCTTSWTLLL